MKISKDIKVDTIDFDLSKLSLEELIEVFQNISDFLKYLNENKIDLEVKSNESR